jgi:hypothetical protein
LLGGTHAGEFGEVAGDFLEIAPGQAMTRAGGLVCFGFRGGYGEGAGVQLDALQFG